MAHRVDGNTTTQQNKKWYCVCCHNYVFMKLDNFLEDFKNPPRHMDWFLPSGLPFKATIFLPQTFFAMSISWTITGQSMIYCL